MWLLRLKIKSAYYGVAQPDFTPAMKRKVRTQFGNKCFSCGSTLKLQLDHHLPISLGYPLVFGNVVVLCRKCNMAKSNTLPHMFYPAFKLERLESMLAEQRAY